MFLLYSLHAYSITPHLKNSLKIIYKKIYFLILNPIDRWPILPSLESEIILGCNVYL